MDGFVVGLRHHEVTEVVMYIREVKTVNKKTGTVYIKHRLVASTSTEKGSRQEVIMELGHLNVPKSQWRKLAHALESMLSGQETLLDAYDSDIEAVAREYVSGERLTRRVRGRKEAADTGERQLATVDLGSVTARMTRGLGAELVCQWAWSKLGMDGILEGCKFTKSEIALARAVIFGKLISPGSELQTYNWFQKRTSLAEMPGADIGGVGKDAFYVIGDKLYDVKGKLEAQLYATGRRLYPREGLTVFLYDLTNTYLEGSALGNALAARGHCKSKRTDCPLITLSMVVDNEGMPVVSHIYKGNQSEPMTLGTMIGQIEEQLWGNQATFIKPTIAMDRGIATDGNIAFLTEKGYPYVVIRREDQSAEYRAVFEAGRESFEVASSGRKSPYGDENMVYVRKVDAGQPGVCKVLCISDGKARKEKAIVSRRDERFCHAVSSLDGSIKAGTIKVKAKIEARLEKIRQKHKAVCAGYDTRIVEDANGRVVGAESTPKQCCGEDLFGCYVMETTHTELDAKQIWKLYMTLTKVESAFRAMKSGLGMRPVYHQNEGRSAAHLFIGVLAFHLLAVIERELSQKGDNREWATIRRVLSTHTRCTVSIVDKDHSIHHIRVSGTPEREHAEIYSRLGVKDPLKTINRHFG